MKKTYQITIENTVIQEKLEKFLSEEKIFYHKTKDILTDEDIIQSCCNYLKVKREDLFLITKEHKISHARAMIYAIFFKLFPEKKREKVAYEVAHQDHASYYYGVGLIKKLSYLPKYKNDFENLTQLITILKQNYDM